MLIFHGILESFIMQNIGNFNHFNIARFEVSSKYVILNCRLIKALLHTHLMFGNAQK